MGLERRVTWTKGPYNTQGGSVGPLDLFSISYTTTRGDAEPWKLRSHLPGLTHREWGGIRVDDCQDKAEELLEHFVARLGAQFPTVEAGSDVS